MNKWLPFYTFLQLLYREWFDFKRQLLSKLMNTSILLLTNIIVFGLLFPKLGMEGTFGPFMLVGAIASFGLFEIVGRAAGLTVDIMEARRISYLLTLPLPSTWVFISIGLSWAMTTAILTFLLFVVGKLVFFSFIDLRAITYLSFFAMFIISNLFLGAFSLWIASLLRSLSVLDFIWFRVINPLFMFGGYFYSWHELYRLSPLLGWLNCLNPMLYIMEGTRSAVLGKEKYLPVWVCFSVLLLATGLCGSFAIRSLKKRLDCV